MLTMHGKRICDSLIRKVNQQSLQPFFLLPLMNSKWMVVTVVVLWAQFKKRECQGGVEVGG